MKRNLVGWVALTAAVCAALGGCSSVPSHTDAWLSFKYETQGPGCGPYLYPSQLSAACPGISNFPEAQNYYNDINAPATLTQWKSTFGFPPPGSFPPARGLYANYRDLRFGRDMNCVQTPNSQQIACYVTNYGPTPSCANGTDADCSWPILEQAVDGAITATPTPPPPAQITSYAVAVGGDLCIAIFQANNSFTAGQGVQINGLSTPTGTKLDGRTLIVLPIYLSNTLFEASLPNATSAMPVYFNCPVSPTTADSGTATYFNSNVIATVAMVYNGTPNTSSTLPPNNVTFYVYDLNGILDLSAALDDEGPKSVPRMCMACHGGSYTPHSGTSAATVKGASFLPFDVLSFYYSSAFNKQYGVNPQQEAFRMLNLLVKTTNGGNQPQTGNQTAIVDFINGMYCPDPNNGGVLSNCSTPVENSGSTASDVYFPSNWIGSANQKLYSDVVKPYCRMCHLAQPVTFFQATDFSPLFVPSLLCTQNDMPHAEVPFGGPAATYSSYMKNGTTVATSNNTFLNSNDTSVFWLDSVAQNEAQTALGISSCQ